MTRAEALAFIVEPMPPGMARETIRTALKGWPAEEVVAWHRMKDNERKQVKRDEKKAGNVRSVAPQQTGQVPVSVEGEDRTSSGYVNGIQPEKEERFQTSKEEKAEEKEKPLRGKKKEIAPTPESVPLPNALAQSSTFLPLWLKFLESRRLIREPMNHLAAEMRLKKLATRPADADAAVEMCIENRWQGFEWTWFDKDRNGQSSPHRNGHEATKPKAPDIREGLDPELFRQWLFDTYPRAKSDFTLATVPLEKVAEYRKHIGK